LSICVSLLAHAHNKIDQGVCACHSLPCRAFAASPDDRHVTHDITIYHRYLSRADKCDKQGFLFKKGHVFNTGASCIVSVGLSVCASGVWAWVWAYT
jgi:hypothetical protein